MKVGVHELVDNVHIIEREPADGLHDIFHSNNIFMEKMAQ